MLPNLTTFYELFKAWTLLGKVFPRRKPFPVLIVDDDEDYCEILKDILSEKPLNLTAECVRSTSEARGAIMHAQFSLVFLDLKFDHDDMAGVNFFNDIKKTRRGLKVVFHSGSMRSLEAVQNGHTVLFVSKNMERESLKVAVAEAVAMNGGFHASPQDTWFAAFMLFAIAAFLGHHDKAIIDWIKKLWATF